MKLYEGMFMLRPDLPEDQTKKIVEGISSEITKAGGTIADSTLSSKQRLAYKIRKHDDGYCLVVHFRVEQAAMEGLTKRLRMNQDLLRHMIVVYTPPPPRPVPPVAPVPAPAPEPVASV